jgi:type IV pilus assembly protein PilC
MRNNERLTPEETLEFNRELLGLIRAGVPLPEGLKRIARELPKGRLQRTVKSVYEALNQGKSLSEAVKTSGDAFRDYYISLIRAGEVSGSMEEVLLQAARMSQSRMKFHQSLRIASIYPFFLLVTCLLIGLIVIIYITPKIEAIYNYADAEMPVITYILSQIRYYTWVKPILPIIVLSLLAFLWWWLSKTRSGKHIRELVLIYLPLTRRLFTFHLVENFTRSLGILLRSNVPMAEALALSRENMDSSLADSIITEMQYSIKNGNPLSSGLKENSPFPPSIRWMLTLCEERGDLDHALLDIAELYESKREFAYLQFVALAQPIFLVLVGLITGIIIGSFYLPLFQLPNIIGM